MNLSDRNKIAPQMEDYDRVGDQWVPYLMRFDCPLKNFAAVSTVISIGFEFTRRHSKFKTQ